MVFDLPGSYIWLFLAQPAKQKFETPTHTPARVALTDGPTDADNPNSEYFGVATEPWQEFSNPITSAHNASRSKNPTGHSVDQPGSHAFVLLRASYDVQAGHS